MFLLRWIFWLGVFAAFNSLFIAAIAYAVVQKKLPPLDVLADYRPRLPLRVYSREGELMGEFGEEKRRVLAYDDFPPLLVASLLATEDARFFSHRGIDWRAFARAVWAISQGRFEGGASTITMQVARNFYLQRQQTLFRKAVEMALATEIERRFAKKEILALYMNQIYLGRGSFGFAAAARTYYGKELKDLTIAEISVLVGVPQAPSRLNPVSSPARAKNRQRHTLRRMRATGLIGEEEYLTAVSGPLPPVAARREVASVDADYIAEEVREIVYRRFGEAAYERGFRVVTTIDAALQKAAVRAARAGVIRYHNRHFYPGPERFVEIAGKTDKQIAALARQAKTIGGLLPAVVVRARRKEIEVVAADGERYVLRGAGLRHAASALPGGKNPRLAAGAVVRLARREEFEEADEIGEIKTAADQWAIVARPEAQAAFVALSPADGAVLAMVGGFDFFQSKFNHATQAKRQPGSGIKPFIYSAALEKGFTPASILYDTPLYLSPAETGSEDGWEPKNYDDEFAGPISLRFSLTKSKNLATVRLLRSIGVDYAQDFLTRFGFAAEDHPPYLTIGLGAGLATPMEMAAGYAVFANGGYAVTPYWISKIEDYDGNVLVRELDFEARRRVIDARNAFVMNSLLASVVKEGTGRGALSLRRGDLAGKTGTTNDTIDAWFCGYGGGVVATAWVGFDQPRSLGKLETGGRAALPIWRDFMRAALAERPEIEYLLPSGVVRARVNPQSGKLVAAGGDGGRDEFFYEEFIPPSEESFESVEAADELF